MTINNQVTIMSNFCGLDFGTSNSSMGFLKNNHIKLTEFDNRTYIPSSIFFEFDEELPCFGDEAIKRYIDGKEGRMIWSPKNALGTNLINEKTQIKDKNVSFKDIIGLIIKNIKKRCEIQSQQEMTSIVVGRPVFYNDKDRKLDAAAQDAMLEILKSLGFKNIEFEYEPIAAAAHYEQSINNEEIALIVDMGGGTSDFTIAKLDKCSASQGKKILSIGGIHIAGTNFDRRLSLNSMMPELGLHSSYKTLEGKWTSIPPTLHKDLATWHKIGFCYNKKNINYVKGKIFCSNSPYKFERLLQTLEQRLGHNLAIAIERAKITLSTHELALLKVQYLEPIIDISITKNEFEESIHVDVEKILSTLESTIIDAQISKTSITAVFMTGGASLVPIVRNSILSSLPQAKLVDGDKFGSVATGLTLIASKKFG
jgi:hypothetical chaperone protein